MMRIDADFAALSSGVKTYRQNTGQLPPPEIGQEALVTRPRLLLKEARWVKLMDQVLKDPWGNPYHYLAGDSVPGGFGFYSCGPDGVSSSLGNDPDDRNTWEDLDRGIDSANAAKRKKLWLWLGGAALAGASFVLGRRMGPSGQGR